MSAHGAFFVIVPSPFDSHPREGGDPSDDRATRENRRWVPAFAGMTVKGSVSYFATVNVVAMSAFESPPTHTSNALSSCTQPLVTALQ